MPVVVLVVAFYAVPVLEILCGAVEVVVELADIRVAHLTRNGGPLVLRAVLPVVRVVRVGKEGAVVVFNTVVVARRHPELGHKFVQRVHRAPVDVRLLVPGVRRHARIAERVVGILDVLELLGRIGHDAKVEPEDFLEGTIVLRHILGQLVAAHIPHIR